MGPPRTIPGGDVSGRGAGQAGAMMISVILTVLAIVAIALMAVTPLVADF